jgi:hypothetical protein
MQARFAARRTRSRLAAFLAASHLLLFVLLPVAHLAAAQADHGQHDCPICQVLQRHDAVDAHDSLHTLIAPPAPRERVVVAALPAAAGHPGHATESRAPPAA